MNLRSLCLCLFWIGCSEAHLAADAAGSDGGPTASDAAICVGSGLACDPAVTGIRPCCFTRQSCFPVGDGTMGVCAYSEPQDAGALGVCSPMDGPCTPRVAFGGYSATGICCNGRQTCFAEGDGHAGVCAYSAPASACAITNQLCVITDGNIHGNCCRAADTCRGGSCGN